MDKKLITTRLKMLLKLVEETQPDSISDNYLFQPHHISVLGWLREVESGGCDREEISRIMKQANTTWKFRNKIKNGEIDNVEESEINEGVMDFLKDNQKINAIKYYRSAMKDQYGTEVGLREAKEYVDTVHIHAKATGLLP